ncbi:MAG: biotin--[acetyl-CoA-carboxylase] ligase [Rikenellaceae bacterium]
MIYFKEETTSTNDDARDQIYAHADVIWAERQSAGRGQRGHSWISGEGLNATFSIILEPTFLEANRQFLISQITALALVDVLVDYGITAKIKWTNDIYVADRKIIGVLIENRLSGSTIARAIIGIGININQMIFDSSLPNPTSMAVEREECAEIPRQEVVERIFTRLMWWYQKLESGEHATVEERYRSKMYRLEEPHPFRLASGEVARASIEGVAPSGALILRHENQTTAEYQFKEVEFVIEQRGR